MTVHVLRHVVMVILGFGIVWILLMRLEHFIEEYLI
jgi:hypothetical protein